MDAVKLANLLRGGYIAQCFVPDRKMMDLRELVRHRIMLVRMRTKLKNKIHGVILMKGIRIQNIYPFSNGYIEKLKELNDYRINGYLHVIDSLNIEIKDVSEKILLYAKENETTKLLMTIPGIGYYSAVLILSEIGDINRFPDSNHLCSYAGLIPSTHSSGGITYHGAKPLVTTEAIVNVPNETTRLRQILYDELIELGKDNSILADSIKKHNYVSDNPMVLQEYIFGVQLIRELLQGKKSKRLLKWLDELERFYEKTQMYLHLIYHLNLTRLIIKQVKLKYVILIQKTYNNGILISFENFVV